MIRAMQLFATVVTVAFMLPSIWILKTGVEQEKVGHAYKYYMNISKKCDTSGIERDKKSLDILQQQHKVFHSLRKYCTRYIKETTTDSLPRYITPEILYHDGKKMLYCAVPNAGAPQWKKYFTQSEGKIKKILMPGYKNRMEPKKLETLSQNQRSVRLSSYYTFLFVRDPFERVLSVYLNLLSSEDNEYKVKVLNEILSNVGRKISDVKDRRISFAEFVAYVVSHLKSPENLGENLRPITLLCSPCLIKYDFIGSYDKLFEQSSFVLDQIGAKTASRFFESSDNEHILAAKYYKSISKENLKKLNNLYKNDIDAFGLSLPKYISQKTMSSDF